MIKRFINWFRNRFYMFVLVKEESSEVFLSEALFKSIKQDHPDDTKFNVLFARTQNKKLRSDYNFFVNPEWEKHGVYNPNLILTIPITVGKNGHVGFQSVQPTVSEILAVLGKQPEQADQLVRLKVVKHRINDEPYYKILP